MRGWATVLGLALVSTACSDDAAGPTTTATTSTSSTSTSTSEATTTSASPDLTSTTGPTGDEVACPVGEALVEPDLDGDGETEPIFIVAVTDGEDDGSQLLVVCDGDETRSLELSPAVWYVGVLDVEPDGVDEVLVGPSDLYDTGVDPTASLRLLVTDGEELGFVMQEQRLLAIGVGGASFSPSGIGCVDLDGDGTRELVRVGVDGGRQDAPAGTVPWTRTPVPRDGGPWSESDEGLFRIGIDDDAIALLGRVSCGDELVELARVSPPATICDDSDGFSYELDVDGDGGSDHVVQRFDRAGDDFPAIAVCTADGSVDQVVLGGMGEVFYVNDPSGTGDYLIWGGGTTVGAAYQEPFAFVDGRLLALSDGEEFFGCCVDGRTAHQNLAVSGCDDLDGDGVVELVQLEADQPADTVEWTRTAWELDGADAAVAYEDSGGFSSDDAIENWGFGVGEAPAEWTALQPAFDCNPA